MTQTAQITPSQASTELTAAVAGHAAPVLTLGRLAANNFSSRATPVSATLVAAFIRAVEFFGVAISGYSIAMLYVKEQSVFDMPHYVIAPIAVGALAVATFQALGLYTLKAFSTPAQRLTSLIAGWSFAFAMLAAAVFFFKIGEDVSRVWMATWFAAGLSVLVVGRGVVASVVRGWARSGRLYQRMAIYGTGPLAEELIRQLEADSDQTVRITGVFDDRDGERAPRQVAGYPRLGGISELTASARASGLDLVMVALPLTAEDRLNTVMQQLAILPVDIKIPARTTALRFSPKTYSHVGSVAALDVFEKPISSWGSLSKWVFDKTIGTVALLLLAPVMAAVAVAIKLDSKGPVLFRQKRYGFNNELIEVFKFRSMYVDTCDATASKLVTRNDPRVTRVGDFIRRTSLDELPQLFNVLLGTLSLVGPRPHALQAKAGSELYDQAVDGYFARHKVKPGITGWAQINGWRGETDTREKIQKRVEHDLYYIENWSVFFDLYILTKTPMSLIKAENAY